MMNSSPNTKLFYSCAAMTSVRKSHFSKGFNVVELMLVVAILGLLATAALPAMTSTIHRMRVRTAADAITSSLYLARSEAIKRAGGVTIQPAGATWNTGWIVRDAAGNILRRSPAFNGVTLTHLGGGATITVDRWGKFTGGGALAGSFSAVPSTSSSVSRAVCVSIGGRISQKPNSATCP